MFEGKIVTRFCNLLSQFSIFDSFRSIEVDIFGLIELILDRLNGGKPDLYFIPCTSFQLLEFRVFEPKKKKKKPRESENDFWSLLFSKTLLVIKRTIHRNGGIEVVTILAHSSAGFESLNRYLQ